MTTHNSQLMARSDIPTPRDDSRLTNPHSSKQSWHYYFNERRSDWRNR